MWEWLFRCAARDPEQARKGRWLNGLFLSFLILDTFLLVLTPFTGSISLLLPDLLLEFLLLALYLVNRAGFVTVAATALVLGLLLGIFAPLPFQALTPALALAYPALFIVVIITGGVFLSWRVGPALVVLCTVLTFGYYYGNFSSQITRYRATDAAGITSLATMLPLLFAAAGALSWLSNRLIAGALADLRRRNADLEVAYSDLAAQSQREHHLGANIGILASQLSTVSTRQVSGVSTQSQSISEIVSAVAELHAAADQIAARAEEVRQVAAAALQSVQRGQELVLRSRDAVQRNRAQVQTVIERMTRLDQLTRRIGGFVNTIRAISDETQLLALNATIEAAGAGPMGRRFSVVASEVQSLSTRSNDSVEQIRTLLAELQEAGQVTLTATQSSITVANEVEALADDVRTVQEQVVGAVGRTNLLVQAISTATHQQTTATAQMTHTMEEIAQVADATRQDTTALETVSTELLQAAEQLTHAISRLQGSEPPAGSLPRLHAPGAPQPKPA